MKRHLVVMVVFLLALVAAAPAQETYNNCGRYGSAKAARMRTLNYNKNRYEPPAANNIDNGITLEKIMEQGDDESRFKDSQAAEITGYVFAVKKGGIETCNCKAKKDEYRDTHIEITLDAEKTGKSQRMIVEVTPRLRALMKKQNIDWSTAALKKMFLHKWVKVKGWMLYDQEHWQNAENTNPDGDNIWRGTAWEIHPVTSIEVAEKP